MSLTALLINFWDFQAEGEGVSAKNGARTKD